MRGLADKAEAPAPARTASERQVDQRQIAALYRHRRR
jgi:hypothetical protein